MAPNQSKLYTDDEAVIAIEKRANRNKTVNELWSRFKRLHSNIDKIDDTIAKYIEGIDNRRNRAATKIEIYNKVQRNIIPELLS